MMGADENLDLPPCHYLWAAFAGNHSCRRSSSDDPANGENRRASHVTGSGFSLGTNTVAALRIAAADIQNIHPQYNPVRYRFLVRDTQHDASRALNADSGPPCTRRQDRHWAADQFEVAMIKRFADAHGIFVISQGSTASSLAIPGDNILWFCPTTGA